MTDLWGEESLLGIYELEALGFFLCLVLCCLFNHLSGSIPELICSSIKIKANREGGGLSIFYGSMAPTDRQTEWRW